MSHGHIMYTAKMCHNWVLGDFIIFILGCNIWAHAQVFGYKLLAMSTPVA